jgi:predicted DNA-binding transcriptional regulator YafY
MPKTSARLLALLSLLQARRDWPGGVLAERLEVSPRTVRRDVDRLRELGYRIAAVKGPDGGYRLDAGTQLPPLLFDDEQAVALAIALRTAATAGAGIEEAAARALHTVRQVMPARLRHRIDTLQVSAVERSPNRPAPRVDSAVFAALGAAVHAREVLRFDYPAAGGGTGGELAPPRRVEPHHLVTRGGHWYLVAWDLDRADWRTFRADRITPRIPTGPRFTQRELPGGDVAAFVARRFRGSDDSDEWPCRGETCRPPSCPATPATGSSRSSARTAAGWSWARGPGPGWPPPSAGSTPPSRSSARLNSRPPSPTWPGATPPRRPVPHRADRPAMS